MKASLITLALLTLAACGSKDDPADDSGSDDTGAPVDADGDGFTAAEDCDDDDATVNPDAVEVCDGVDNNCDAQIDEGVSTTYWTDADGDGFGDAGAPVERCAIEAGVVANNQDCDDGEAQAYPGAVEVCDGIDNDCDGAVDDEDSSLDRSTASAWYVDADGDGYGAPDTETLACEAPRGSVAESGDCDDSAPEVNPGAEELCNGVDDDCDPATTEDGRVTEYLPDGSASDISDIVRGTLSAPAQAQTAGEALLRFCDGTYYLNLDLAGDVTVEGLNGADRTVLNAAGGGPALYSTTSGVALSISGVTLTGGTGLDTESLATGNGGGGFACLADGSTTVTLDEVAVVGNEAETGGGLFVLGCELSISNSDFSANTANTSVGGLLIVDGVHEITDTSVTGNESASHTGGMMVQAAYERPELVMDEVEVSQNHAVEHVGGFAALSSDVTWTGSSSSASGMSENSIDGGVGGGLYLYDSEFSGVVLDLGVDSADNSFTDVFVDDIDFQYHAGDDLSFDCDPEGCGAAVDYALGDSVSSNDYAEILKANIIQATGTATLNEFSIYLNPDSSCTVDFYVLTDTDVDDSWDVAWSSLGQTSIGADYYSSGPIGIAVEEGVYYGLMVGAACTGSGEEALYYFDRDYVPTTGDGGFGDSVAHIDEVNNYSAPLSETAELETYASSTLRYDMIISVTEL
ncbi:MAG: putative metal-binding motif-containing protein [Alphaproteobacteria bacterium]|nr:putative metal-binding motif-containing protein [Alphaproteobacteria bacterium]